MNRTLTVIVSLIVAALSPACLTPTDADLPDPSPSASASPTAAPAPPTRHVAFVNSAAFNDRVTVFVDEVTPAAAGTTYVVWLVDDVGTGYLQVATDIADMGFIVKGYTDGGGADLFATYSSALVSLEDEAGATALTEPAGPTLYSGGHTGNQLQYGRELISDNWAEHPSGTPPFHGMTVEASIAVTHVHNAENEVSAGQMANALAEVELVYNVFAGMWDEFDVDGGGITTAAGSDRFGLRASDDGGANSYVGYVRGFFDIIDALVGAEETGSPLWTLAQRVLECEQPMDTGTTHVLTGSLALTTAPVELQFETAQRLHFDTDIFLDNVELCVGDEVDALTRIPLAAP